MIAIGEIAMIIYCRIGHPANRVGRGAQCPSLWVMLQAELAAWFAMLRRLRAAGPAGY
jgi:hypothetical protein